MTSMRDEKFWTVTLGGIGCAALAWNLYRDPSDWPNVIVNFAQIGVGVIVFFMTNSIVKRLQGKKDDFREQFDMYIRRWGADNTFLVDTSQMEISQSKERDTRIVYMILDLTTFGERPAEQYSSKQKGAFLYLPSRDDSRPTSIEFKINPQLFSRIPNFEQEKDVILERMSARIRERFAESLGITVKPLKSELKVQVDFSGMEQTKENAERLKDIVEFVKTMILALA